MWSSISKTDSMCKGAQVASTALLVHVRRVENLLQRNAEETTTLFKHMRMSV